MHVTRTLSLVSSMDTLCYAALVIQTLPADRKIRTSVRIFMSKFPSIPTAKPYSTLYIFWLIWKMFYLVLLKCLLDLMMVLFLLLFFLIGFFLTLLFTVLVSILFKLNLHKSGHHHLWTNHWNILYNLKCLFIVALLLMYSVSFDLCSEETLWSRLACHDVHLGCWLGLKKTITSDTYLKILDCFWIENKGQYLTVIPQFQTCF